MEQSTIAIIIMIIVIILYATEIIPIAMTSLAGCLAMAVFGILPFKDAFSGFSDDVVMMVVGMMVIGNAIFETGVAEKIGKVIIKGVGTNERLFIVVIILVTSILSAFLSNTATVAMFIPIIATAALASGGKITKKNTYMALGFGSVAGGVCTIVGSTPQLVAQGILLKLGERPIGFFELAKGGLPIVILMLVFFTTIGYRLQQKVFDFPEKNDIAIINGNGQAAATSGTRKYKTLRMWIAVFVLIGCVIGFITRLWTVGAVAIVGALICIVTGCIPEKKAYVKMDWVSVVVLGGALGFSKGLDVSGAGEVISNFAIRLLGTNTSPWLIFAVLVGVSTLLTNIMSNTAAVCILAPISIGIAKGLGIDPTAIVIGIVIGANLSFANPIATTPVTMTLVAGYRFMDYVKIGGLVTVLGYILTIILLPLFLGL